MEIWVEFKLTCSTLSLLWGALHGQSCYQKQNCPCRCANSFWVHALFLYMGTTFVICGSRHRHGTFFQRLASNSHRPTRTFQWNPHNALTKETKISLPCQFVGETKKCFFPLLVAHLKGLLHFELINFQNKPHNGHGNEHAQWNVHARFILGVDIEFL